jgi:hypothetical protein
MIPEFDKLSDSEVELMFKAPVLACILIAGADGNIDKKEVQSAIEFARKKQKGVRINLTEFYRYVGEDFEDKFKIVLQNYPVKAAQRTPMIVEELSGLNNVLPKLDKTFAIAFYNSIKEIAVNIANSSGGLLGPNKIGEEEAKYVGLPMIEDPSK